MSKLTSKEEPDFRESNHGTINLKQLLVEEGKEFYVPDYQRGYSWENEQRQDLISDIEQIEYQNYCHYTGTIVASLRADLNSYDIVDGQQRITSIILMIASVVRAARKRGLEYVDDDAIDSIETDYLFSGAATGNTKYRLNLGFSRDALFREVIRYGKPINQSEKNKTDRNTIEASLQFDRWILGMDDKGLANVYRVLTNQLGFLFYAPKNDAEVGLMFEVINNRGKPLSELEKIKNYLIYFAGRHDLGDLKGKVNESWPLILESLNAADQTSNDDENSFLRVCWIVFHDYQKARSYHVYDNLKKLCPSDSPTHFGKLLQFVDFLVSGAQTYRALHCATSSNLSKAEIVSLERISLHHANAAVLPLIVALYSRDETDDDRAKTLDLLEKVNFRYYVTGIAKRNDTGHGELFKLAHDYFGGGKLLDNDNDDENERVELSFVHNQLTRFVDENASDYNFVKSLTLDKDESGDYIKWNGLKLFLASYEDKLLGESKESSKLRIFLASEDPDNRNDFFHREHIWAIQDYKNIDDRAERHVNKRRLGNFTLLKAAINIKAGKLPPEKKVLKYFESTDIQPDTLMIRELKSDLKKATRLIEKTDEFKNLTQRYYRTVYQTMLDIREQRLVEFALERWRVDGVSKPVRSVVIDSSRDSNEIFFCEPKYSVDID